MNHTLDQKEAHHFDHFAESWWDEKGPFKQLHQINPLRLTFIKEAGPFDSFKGLSLLDIGCGGGLVCEPLARLGANVTGIDTSKKAIEVAKQHAQRYAQGFSIEYRCLSVEELAQEQKVFDIVIAFEILEHVHNVDLFIASCAKLLSENGIFILSTLNRTWQSYLLAIVGAEYLLRWIPLGTHHWEKFLKPCEIETLLQAHDLHFNYLKGMSFNPFKQEWSLTSNLTVNYLGVAAKTPK
ncbi:MAG: bifunctional 2-polyprenyl-6-hydroxyphenol methylase/3-demethylubiquinol 3-O-methyltransferase UbiG [Proteobacteria bacterium]|nr:bifunctional 2-polyprenyl-6-hydroxyphenol methylase/3-demethylubiquinol 3-O-methyltransferase UbiG [Pseudomonadota bacterium]